MGTHRKMMAIRGKNGNTNREHQKWWQLEVKWEHKQRTSEMMAFRCKNGNTNREYDKWWQLEVRKGTQSENMINDGN